MKQLALIIVLLLTNQAFATLICTDLFSSPLKSQFSHRTQGWKAGTRTKDLYDFKEAVSVGFLPTGEIVLHAGVFAIELQSKGQSSSDLRIKKNSELSPGLYAVANVGSRQVNRLVARFGELFQLQQGFESSALVGQLRLGEIADAVIANQVKGTIDAFMGFFPVQFSRGTEVNLISLGEIDRSIAQQYADSVSLNGRQIFGRRFSDRTILIGSIGGASAASLALLAYMYLTLE